MVSECFLMIFWILCTIQWYLKLPLRVPLSPAEISLNGPMVLNGIQWYSMVFNGIPLALFCKGRLTKYIRSDNYTVK